MPTSLISPAAWIMLAVVIGADAVLCLALGLSVRFSSLATAMLVGTAAFAVAWFYAVRRPDPSLAVMSASVGFLVVFTPFGAILSYATTAFNLPLLDHWYALADEWMGLDWLAIMRWIAEVPHLPGTLRFFYSTSLPHVAIAIVALGMSGQSERLKTFIFLFAATGAVTCVLSGLLPAAGAFPYHAPSAELRAAFGEQVGVWHVAHFNGLRDGTFTMIDLMSVQGLVTFPSYHTALAVVCAWATWSVRLVAWPSALLGTLIIVATPHIGGHFVVDIVAGAAIAFAAIWLVQRQWSPSAVRETAALANG